jgi:molecular chaperone HtpG
MKQGHIDVQAENIFPIIKKFLYSSHDIFIRELIANAVDATSKLKTLSSKGEFKGKLGDLTIDVSIDKDNNTITISDNGIGMTEEEVLKYLNQVAFSSAQDFLEKYKDESQIIGHFGLGFYSSYMVADKVEVITKSWQKDATALKWTCNGEPEYTLEDAERKARGTDIILHINEDEKEFLEIAKLEELLKKYCKFMPYPIRFGTKTESTWEGEGEDKKEIKTEVDNIINDKPPLWKKTPSELKDEDYLEFYDTLHPFSQPPLFWIHLNIDYPFNLTGILYFPKIGNALEMQRNKIQLYSNQVFVTDEVKDIVPEFLTLLHGVIDSPDIPLNVSRSYLQGDRNVQKISGYITKKVSERLSNLFKEDRENYNSKWDEIGTFVKYGMISNEKFHEKADKFCLLKNTNGEYFTFDEYKEKIKTAQTDKDSKIINIYTPAVNHFNSYVKAAEEKGYDVLLMDQIIDNHFMQHIETKLHDLKFIRVDAETPDNLIQKDESIESVLTEKELEKVKSLFTDNLKTENNQMEFKPMSPDAMPVVITRPEFMRRMQEMQAMQNMGESGFPDMYNVVINTNHKLVTEKLLKMRSAEKKADFVKYLYDLALLNQQMLKGEDMTAFINRSMEFVG